MQHIVTAHGATLESLQKVLPPDNLQVQQKQQKERNWYCRFCARNYCIALQVLRVLQILCRQALQGIGIGARYWYCRFCLGKHREAQPDSGGCKGGELHVLHPYLLPPARFWIAWFVLDLLYLLDFYLICLICLICFICTWCAWFAWFAWLDVLDSSHLGPGWVRAQQGWLLAVQGPADQVRGCICDCQWLFGDGFKIPTIIIPTV